MKLFISFILLSFVLFVVVWIQPIRTIGGMEYIARKELWATMEEIHRNQGYAIVEDIKGPIITEHDSLNYVDFKWYTILPWGDTSAIYTRVYKSLTSLSLNDEYFWPKSSMDVNWIYVGKPNSNFSDLLNSNHFSDSAHYRTFDTSKYRFSIVIENENEGDTLQLLIDKERIFEYLKRGYFNVDGKLDKSVVVLFYEEYAQICNNKTNEKTLIETAKIKIDSLNIMIIPWIVPIEVRDKFNEIRRKKWDSVQKIK